MIIVVTGIPRSGTSAVAGVLHKLGCHMGDHLNPGAALNPSGFFEDMEFIELHAQTEFIGVGANHWFDIPKVVPLDFRNAYRAMILSRSNSRPVWGVKDLRILHTLDQFLDEASDVKVVEVWRSPSAVIDSFDRYLGGRRTLRDLVDAYSNWLTLLLSTWPELSKRGVPCLPIYYEELIGNPRMIVARIADYVNLEVNDAAIAHINARVE